MVMIGNQKSKGEMRRLKLGRCIKELERIYGVKNGNNQHTRASELSSDPHKKTQSDLAEDFNMSTRQLRKYKSLTDLIPELQEAVESGRRLISKGVEILPHLKTKQCGKFTTK